MLEPPEAITTRTCGYERDLVAVVATPASALLAVAIVVVPKCLITSILAVLVALSS